MLFIDARAYFLPRLEIEPVPRFDLRVDRMKSLRIVALVVVAAAIGWIAFKSIPPRTPDAPAVAPPVREAFHVAKTLRLEVLRLDAEGNKQPERGWLERELRHLLARGKMKLEPVPASEGPKPFTLRVTLGGEDIAARAELIAPDGIRDRNETIELSKQSHLDSMRSFAQRLPVLLGAPNAQDWAAFLGTGDSAAYDTFLRATDELLAPAANGFSAPPKPAQSTVLNLERIETLARRHRDFARARALLSIAYLSVGGEDQASLMKLAETAAERALTADPQLDDAHAALGIVRMRRMDWSAAQEHFDAALAIDASSVPALEGLGCLLIDLGHAQAALPIALRAATLQPGNQGARECASYARIAIDAQTPVPAETQADVARIFATIKLLAGDSAAAESLLRSNNAAPNELIDAVLAASADRARIPDALQVITSAADDERINAETELLLGTALRRPDFVFNRMLRLTKQTEAVPLRMLWLPQTDFLRKHRRFKEIVSAASLSAYWQDHGVPDVCASEPKVAGCALKPK